MTELNPCGCGPMVVRSGDTLLIAFHGVMTRQMAHEITTQMEENLPGVVIMLIDRVASVAVHRPDE